MFSLQHVMYCRGAPAVTPLSSLRVVRIGSLLVSNTTDRVPLKSEKSHTEKQYKNLKKNPKRQTDCRHEKTGSSILLTNVSWREPYRTTETKTVLTPGSMLRRLEALIPPKVHQNCKKGHGRELSTCAAAVDSFLLVTASGTSKPLQPCCKPVPWNCVYLHRVGTDLTKEFTPNMRDHAEILTVPAVYNVLIPPEYLLTSSNVRPTRKGAHRSLKNRSHAFQHIGILHHIPGLPDPVMPRMTLDEYVNYLQSFYSQTSRLESETRPYFSTQKGINNRDAKGHSLQSKLLHSAPEAVESDDGGAIECHNGAVGVWIVHPWEESVFFAVRYRLGFDYYDWAYRPIYTLCNLRENAEVEKEARAKVMNDAKRISWSWAQEPLQKAKKSKMGQLPSAYYYYATGVNLNEKEKGCSIVQMLGNDESCRVAKSWTPLPRSTRQLRARNLMRNPTALAEELKYGLLRIFTD